MNHFTGYLSGKVRKRSLPVFTDPSQVAASAQKRLQLPQGELAQIYNEPTGMQYLAYIELLPDHPRGNHYHERKEEWVYLLKGKLSLTLEDIASKQRETLSCEAGDLIVISPLIAHAFTASEVGMALEFAGNQFDPGDIKRYMLW